MQIKIGQIYKVKPEFRDVCWNFMNREADYITFINEHDYQILDQNKKVIAWCQCFKPEHLEPLEKTLYNLEVNDFVEDKDGEKRKVLGLIESSPENPVYVLSYWGDLENGNTISAKYLERNSYKVVQPEPTEEIKVEITTAPIDSSLVKFDKKTAQILLSAFHENTKSKIDTIYEVITKEKAEDTINKMRKGIKVKIQD